MRRIVVLDTWINATNLGNKIIVEAVMRELREVFPGDFFYQVPALEYLRASRKLVKQADFVFLAGANLLSSDMNRSSTCGWCLRYTDMLWLRNVILIGLGWWQYQPYPPNLYTRTLLRLILKRNYYHAVRDSYTANRLRTLGFNVLNTGCPTIWKLTKQHCAEIAQTKATDALLTFTGYNRKPDYDKLLYEVVKKNYQKVYFWPQNYRDYEYARDVCDNGLIFINSSVEALDDLLENQAIDHVGTRLHGGIRALQHKQRSFIVAVDNRASEMGKDFNLPVIPREKIGEQLELIINTNYEISLNIDNVSIAAWKNQFSTQGQLDGTEDLGMMKVKNLARSVLPSPVRRGVRRMVDRALY
jgi:polysaccharide pyruvyl transferase WcaK-like protein